MALDGGGFLALWSDVQSEAEAEWRRWHVREHMPDRLKVPGILRGRRYYDRTAIRHRTFMIYEGRDVSVFDSPAYLAQLNEPSPETRRLLPFIRNILRGVFQTIAAVGGGLGEVAAVIRLGFDDPTRGFEATAAGRLVRDAASMPGVLGAQIGVIDRGATGIPTTEQALRNVAPDALDAIILIEGRDRASVARAAQAVIDGRTLPPVRPSGLVCGTYDLVYVLAEPQA